MEKYLISEQKLVDIADAIREKTETSEPIVVSQMDEAIRAIQVGVDTSDATAAAEDILSGETAYVNEQKITGSMTNNGAVSATLGFGDVYTVPNGFHSGSGTVTAPSLPALNNSATASDIVSGHEAIDANGVKIEGTYTPPTVATLTADATVTSNAQILSGYTAYSKGTKYTGNFVPERMSMGDVQTTYVSYNVNDLTINAGFRVRAFVIYNTENNGTYGRVWVYDGSTLVTHGSSSRGATVSVNTSPTIVHTATSATVPGQSSSGGYKYIAFG